MKMHDYIFKNMPPNLTQLEKARYIYLKLAMVLNFSTKFNNTPIGEHFKMYTEGTEVKDIKYNQIVCTAWAKIYSDLLNEIGIETAIINKHHRYVQFKCEGRIWLADATYNSYTGTTDLSRVKYGNETIYFGPTNAENLEDKYAHITMSPEVKEQIKNIDKKFPFYQERKERLNNLILTLHDIGDMNMTIKQKMETLFGLVGRLDSGFYESKSYIRMLENHLLAEEELKNVKGKNLLRTNRNGEVDIIQCLYINENGNYSYYLLAPELPIRKVTKEEVAKLACAGFGLEKDSIPGVDYPNKFHEGKVSRKSITYRIFKKAPGVIAEFDREQYRKLSV